MSRLSTHAMSYSVWRCFAGVSDPLKVLRIVSRCCCGFSLIGSQFRFIWRSPCPITLRSDTISLFLHIPKRLKYGVDGFVAEVFSVTTRLKLPFLSLCYKYVVKIECIIAVICIMKRQRRNDVLVEQVVERLKTIRRDRGLTQENVRFDTDLNIGRIESGRHSISLTTLADLCDYYGIPLEDFFKKIVTR